MMAAHFFLEDGIGASNADTGLVQPTRSRSSFAIIDDIHMCTILIHMSYVSTYITT
jgi:hypothetical protein